jgi:hypothetical protein
MRRAISRPTSFVPLIRHGLLLLISTGLALAGCRGRANDRTIAERVARDTASRAWRHDVGVDSVRQLGDTTIVWVSPRNWMATDAPQAGVRVGRGGRVVSIQWIMGG